MSEDRSQKPRPPEQAGRLRPGTIIDHRFTLVRRLGAGSSGVVWASADEGERFRPGERVRVLRDGGTTRVSR